MVTKASLPKTPSARKNCFTPKHICLSIAQWHGFNPKTERITINPAEGGHARLEHARQHQQQGRLLVHRRKEERHLVQPAGDRRSGDHADDLLHVRDPSLDAGLDQGSAAGRRPPSSSTSERSTSTPRLGRRAFLGALGGGALAYLLPVKGGGLGELLPFGERDRRARPRRCRSGRRCRSRAS